MITDNIVSICWNRECEKCSLRNKSNSCLIVKTIVLQTKLGWPRKQQATV